MSLILARACLVAALLLLPVSAAVARAQVSSGPGFDVFEASIPELQAALTTGRTTSRQLVQAYLARIDAYDERGPRLNAVQWLNPNALEEADRLDRARARGEARGALFGVPLLVKDNFDTVGMPTSGGALALATLRPDRDAELVARLRAAGAIILGKTSMHELASGITTLSSLSGETRNPYDPRRSPGGSSGGSAAAATASFAAAALGTDTCGSLRIPAAYQNLFALRSTQGLLSRVGIMPLSPTQDVPGPMARSVTDLAILLDAMVTTPVGYLEALRPGGLRGVRIGVLRSYFAAEGGDQETLGVLAAALETLKTQGVEVVDIAIPDLEATLKDAGVVGFEFRPALADYLAERHAPVASLGEIIDNGLEHEGLEERLRARNPSGPRDEQAYRAALAQRGQVRAMLIEAMDRANVTALAYPTALQKPMLWGGESSGRGTCQISASSGLPALSIPAGLDVHGLPIGLDLLGRPLDEAALLSIALGWEGAAQPRRAPFSTPSLRDGPPARVLHAKLSIKANGQKARIRLSYDPSTAQLVAQASWSRGGRDIPVALALHRGSVRAPGPVLAPILVRAGGAGAASLYLDARDRENLRQGRLFIRLYTRGFPLGAASAAAPRLADWR